jgi:hypothetical protein
MNANIDDVTGAGLPMRLRCTCLVIHAPDDLRVVEQDAGDVRPRPGGGAGGLWRHLRLRPALLSCRRLRHRAHQAAHGAGARGGGHGVGRGARCRDALKVGDKVAVNPSRPCGRLHLLPGRPAQPVPGHALLRQRDARPARRRCLSQPAGVRCRAVRAGGRAGAAAACGAGRALLGGAARRAARRCAAGQAGAGVGLRAHRKPGGGGGAHPRRGRDHGRGPDRRNARRRPRDGRPRHDQRGAATSVGGAFQPPTRAAST